MLCKLEIVSLEQKQNKCLSAVVRTSTVMETGGENKNVSVRSRQWPDLNGCHKPRVTKGIPRIVCCVSAPEPRGV